MTEEISQIKQQVYDLLDKNEISYEVYEHIAVYTIDEMDQLQLPHAEAVVKNLFLRDDKGREHFLVVLGKEKKADLNFLREQLQCKNLSFASEDRLNRYLHLKKGSVTPFGILNDTEHTVRVVFDKELIGGLVGIHPNDNTATVFIAFDDLVKIIEQNGNQIEYVEMG